MNKTYKNYFISIYITVLTILYFGSTVNAAVGQICTSAQVAKVPNLVTLGVIVDVKQKEWSPGSKIPVKIKVNKGAVIKNVIIWAESVNSDQPGAHFGSFSPVAGHVFIAGCGGFPEATIANDDNVPLNVNSMVYVWNAPQAAATAKTATTSVPSAAPPAVKNLDTTTANNNNITVKSHQDGKPHDETKVNQFDFGDLPELQDLSNFLKNYPRSPQLPITRFGNSSSILADPQNVLIKGSVIFKGVLQLENKPANEIFSIESKVIKMANPSSSAKSASVDENSSAKSASVDANSSEKFASVDANSLNDWGNHTVKGINIDDKIPKNPLISASYSNIISNRFYSFVLASFLSSLAAIFNI